MGGREKVKARRVKREKGKEWSRLLASNSTMPPDRAHARTHEQNETKQFPGWTHPQSPILLYLYVVSDLLVLSPPRQTRSHNIMCENPISQQNRQTHQQQKQATNYLTDPTTPHPFHVGGMYFDESRIFMSWPVVLRLIRPPCSQGMGRVI